MRPMCICFVAAAAYSAAAISPVSGDATGSSDSSAKDSADAPMQKTASGLSEGHGAAAKLIRRDPGKAGLVAVSVTAAAGVEEPRGARERGTRATASAGWGRGVLAVPEAGSLMQ
eukprot:CAMPEP_0204522228 /NCGR_PEP_ID=MMETSP0661-20131031/6206_1 /ASSEMBLY_ACC=CAM_ASM_000606 /TAXON_ID=109239 /ORGANISM="Alexandrium margalefi, Strain AMGDE01CS-322" /LENGTH=114 /DNA_ID=CAMNT_0051527873 /DNA_START=64 /DNA_END=405 /DNA_ORIENTATION=+